MKLRYIWLLVPIVAGCRVGEVAPPATTPTTPARTEPMVRIGLKVDTAAVALSTTTAAQLLDQQGARLGDIAANDTWTFSVRANNIVGSSQGGRTFTSNNLGIIRLQPAADGYVMIGDKRYRGEMLLRRAGNDRITLINVLDMERYLLGVVPYEIGRPANALEAIKAQAIAARTYAIGGMGSRSALGFDFYATVADQVYGGASGEDSVVSRAVMETRGEIITYQGEPIIAYYSSTCGGRTASVPEVWPWRASADRPYLQGISDLMPDGQTAYCQSSNRFRWSVTWGEDSLRHVLQNTIGGRLNDPNFRIQRIDNIQITGKTSSGRAEALNIMADGVTHRIPADSIRWVLRPRLNGSLNSSLIFELHALAQDAGMPVSRLEVEGGGWGHGIGMCQVGAIGRARAGHNYRQILTAYYTGVEISRLY